MVWDSLVEFPIPGRRLVADSKGGMEVVAKVLQGHEGLRDAADSGDGDFFGRRMWTSSTPSACAAFPKAPSRL